MSSIFSFLHPTLQLPTLFSNRLLFLFMSCEGIAGFDLRLWLFSSCVICAKYGLQLQPRGGADVGCCDTCTSIDPASPLAQGYRVAGDPPCARCGRPDDGALQRADLHPQHFLDKFQQQCAFLLSFEGHLNRTLEKSSPSCMLRC